MLDESESIGLKQLGHTKKFLSQLVGSLDIDSGQTRVALVTYSTNVRTVFALNAYTTVASVQSAIESLVIAEGGTSTAAALAHVRTSMLTSSAGARSTVADVVVVLTDGRSNNATATRVSIKHIRIITTATVHFVSFSIRM